MVRMLHGQVCVDEYGGGGGNIQQWMEAATNERANEQTNERVIG